MSFCRPTNTCEFEEEIKRQHELIRLYRDTLSLREQVDRLKRDLLNVRFKLEKSQGEVAELSGQLAAVEAILSAERLNNEAEVGALRRQIARLEARVPYMREAATGLPAYCLRCATMKTGNYFCAACYKTTENFVFWELVNAWDAGARDFPRPKAAA